MKKLTNLDIDSIENKSGIEIPRLYRKLLIEIGFGETENDNEIYHPDEIDELYEFKFDDEMLLYKKYFPFGCNNSSQELWIIDVENDKVANIYHETHEDDWLNEEWKDYETWVEQTKI